MRHACRAVISVFNSNPSHFLLLQDRPEKKRVRLEHSSKSTAHVLERLFGCDMNGSVVWHAEDAMISVKVLV